MSRQANPPALALIAQMASALHPFGPPARVPFWIVSPEQRTGVASFGRKPSTLACFVVLALLTAGCAGPQSHRLLETLAADAGGVIATHGIYVATTRAKAQDTAEIYSGERGDMLGFARIDVSVPSVHKPGELERPSGRARRDAARHFAAARAALYPGGDTFRASLRESLAQTDGRALVFVHGYRTPFDGSVYRMTQIVHDSGYAGTAVLFSWASTGRTTDYIYDNNSATIARDGLEKTLRLLRAAGARRIDIVAHSMGNWVLMEALRQLAIAGDRDIGGSLGDVVMAAPDIDVDVFKSQLQRIGKPDKPFFVLLSRDDRALLVSSLIAGNRPRVGDYDKDDDLAEMGVVVVDISGVASSDRFNHDKFAGNPLVVQMLGARLNEDDAFSSNADDAVRRVETMAQELGRGVGTAAAIVITLPFDLARIAIGGG